MAITSLLTALKIVPWADVITAAPGLVKGARKMFQRTQDEVLTAETAPLPEFADATTRLRALEARVHDLMSQQKAAAQLVEGLAEQNAAVVQALAVVRARQRWVWVTLTVVMAGWLATLVLLSYGVIGGR